MCPSCAPQRTPLRNHAVCPRCGLTIGDRGNVYLAYPGATRRTRWWVGALGVIAVLAGMTFTVGVIGPLISRFMSSGAASQVLQLVGLAISLGSGILVVSVLPKRIRMEGKPGLVRLDSEGVHLNLAPEGGVKSLDYAAPIRWEDAANPEIVPLRQGHFALRWWDEADDEQRIIFASAARPS
jgi:hypothetical protein